MLARSHARKHVPSEAGAVLPSEALNSALNSALLHLRGSVLSDELHKRVLTLISHHGVDGLSVLEDKHSRKALNGHFVGVL